MTAAEDKVAAARARETAATATTAEVLVAAEGLAAARAREVAATVTAADG